jgi:hypothetical protein
MLNQKYGIAVLIQSVNIAIDTPDKDEEALGSNFVYFD